jgi:hypothetical protein
MIESSQRNSARVLGITYPLTFVILMVAFVRFYAPLLVWENGTRTARNFLGHDRDILLYLGAALIYGIGVVILLTALYLILRPMGRGLALFAAFCRLVYAFLWFVMMLDLFSALRAMSGAGRVQMLEIDQLAELAGLQLASGRDAYYIGLGFYGLGTLIFSCLWLKSRYVPRTLSAWGVLSSVFITVCAFAYLLNPGFGKIVSADWYELPTGLFEMVTSFWLLIRGLRPTS